jgi:hypothetical protein
MKRIFRCINNTLEANHAVRRDLGPKRRDMQAHKDVEVKFRPFYCSEMMWVVRFVLRSFNIHVGGSEH